LRDSRFDEVRNRFDSKFKSIVGGLESRDPVGAAAVKDLRDSSKSLNELLATGAGDLSPSQYIEARKYLDQLTQAIRAIDDPKVVNYFNERWSARGRTVAELVGNMRKDGLRFAPATPGEEAHYTTLYQALRAFEAGPQLAASGGGRGSP
jgi:hypothetical protein